MRTQGAIHTSRFFVPVLALILFAAMSFLFVARHDIYMAILRAIIVFPTEIPFLDGASITAAIAWASRGVNVYEPSPYFFPLAYSPLWLWFTFLPSGPRADYFLGAGVAVAFLLSLATLPTSKDRLEFWVRFFATISCGTVLALERANIDVPLFVLVLAGIHLNARSSQLRLFSHALFIFAGLLKFYPFAALLVAIRERRAALVFVVALGSIVLLFGLYWNELQLVIRNFPPHRRSVLEFSAIDLPLALTTTVTGVGGTDRFSAAYPWLTPLLVAWIPAIGLIALSVSAGFVLSRRCEMEGPHLPAGRFERIALVAGAAIIVVCFVVGQNFLYRGIFGLLVLPGLFVMARASPSGFSRVVFAGACIAFAFAMWSPFIYSIVGTLPLPVEPARLALWLAYEAAWWWIVTTLFAIGFAYAMPVFRSWWVALRRGPSSPVGAGGTIPE